jgi:hypothetical protein
MLVHIGQELWREIISRSIADHGIDATVGAESCRTFGMPLIVTSIFYLLRCKYNLAVEASACLAGENLIPVPDRFAVCSFQNVGHSILKNTTVSTTQ